jgi:hypothetical protein
MYEEIAFKLVRLGAKDLELQREEIAARLVTTQVGGEQRARK